MDCRTGDIKILVDDELIKTQEKALKNLGHRLLELDDKTAKELLPLEKPLRKNIMRNKSCPCGSEIKFKRCCWNKYTQRYSRDNHERN